MKPNQNQKRLEQTNTSNAKLAAAGRVRVRPRRRVAAEPDIIIIGVAGREDHHDNDGVEQSWRGNNNNEEEEEEETDTIGSRSRASWSVPTWCRLLSCVVCVCVRFARDEGWRGGGVEGSSRRGNPNEHTHESTRGGATAARASCHVTPRHAAETQTTTRAHEDESPPAQPPRALPAAAPQGGQ